MAVAGTGWSRGLSLGRLAALGAGVWLGLRWIGRERVDFDGRTVLITGGTRGLGFLLARLFLEEGARVAICGRDEATLERARTQLQQQTGGEVLAIPCDVSRKDQIEAAVARVRERFGPVEVLINNAGIIQVGPHDAMREEDFQEALGIHLWGPLYATRAVLPDMRRQGWGRIVNISSIGGRVSVPHLLPYNVSKFALVGLSDGLRAELAQEGIRVTTVCPGLMRTGSPRNAFFKGDAPRENAWFTLGDSLPGLSLSAERAARRIFRACRRGKAEEVVGLPARVAVLARTLAPGLTASLLSTANRLLPQGTHPERRAGRDSQLPVARGWLTWLTQRAERQYNQREAPTS